jgi:putative flippase GtrA
MKITGGQLIGYLIAGAIAYGVDVGCFSALRYFFRLSVANANVSARLAGAIAAYLLNYYWTFSAHTYSTHAAVVKYALLWLVSTSVSTGAMLVFISTASRLTDEIALKCAVEIVVIFCNFLVCKYWVYKKASPP